MNVHVSEQSGRIIRSQIRSGRFSSESEVIDAALGLLDQRVGVPEPVDKNPSTEEEFKRQLLESGLMTRLPIPLDPASYQDFHPVELDGEPLSETIIRERR
jgi:putative addiction module CopG family antidote